MNELERLRTERDQAIAALRLYRAALVTVADLLRFNAKNGCPRCGRPQDPIEAGCRIQLGRALAAAEGILRSLE